MCWVEELGTSWDGLVKEGGRGRERKGEEGRVDV